MQISNKRVFFELFHDKMTAKHVPGLLANAMEFRKNYVPSASEKRVMQKMFKYEDMEDFKPPAKGGQDKYNRKMLLIIVSYMMRLPEGEDAVLKQPKEEVLKLSTALIELLLDTASEI